MYQEYPPCQLLAPYIDKYWEFKGETEYDMRYKILPDGCTDFIIFYRGTVATSERRDADATLPFLFCRSDASLFGAGDPLYLPSYDGCPLLPLRPGGFCPDAFRRVYRHEGQCVRVEWSFSTIILQKCYAKRSLCRNAYI